MARGDVAYQSVAITNCNSATLRCNPYGQLGLGDTVKKQKTPTRVLGQLRGKKVMQAVAGAGYVPCACESCD